MPLAIQVDGRAHAVDVDGATPLLYVLRNDLGLNGPKFGCGLGQCGACTVLVDGAPTRSCLLPVSALGARRVTTVAGLGTPQAPHPLQAAFIAEQAAQCGYCTSGMLVAAKALLAEIPLPTDAQVRERLASQLCRCGAHNRIVRAVLRASREMAS